MLDTPELNHFLHKPPVRCFRVAQCTPWKVVFPSASKPSGLLNLTSPVRRILNERLRRRGVPSAPQGDIAKCRPDFAFNRSKPSESNYSNSGAQTRRDGQRKEAARWLIKTRSPKRPCTTLPRAREVPCGHRRARRSHRGKRAAQTGNVNRARTIGTSAAPSARASHWETINRGSGDHKSHSRVVNALRAFLSISARCLCRVHSSPPIDRHSRDRWVDPLRR